MLSGLKVMKIPIRCQTCQKDIGELAIAIYPNEDPLELVTFIDRYFKRFERVYKAHKFKFHKENGKSN